MSYDSLVAARKKCRLCKELVNPADASHAQFDNSEVGPWTRWLAARPAKLVLVGQDWGTVGYFREYLGRDVQQNLTNKRLAGLLALLGFEVGPPDQTDRQSGVFATNAILCLKPGEANALSGGVQDKWYSACRPLLKWTIEETSTPTVIALGRRAYEAVAAAYQIKPPKFSECIGLPIHLDNERVLFAVFHPAARPVNRTLSQMHDDWGRIAKHLRGERPTALSVSIDQNTSLVGPASTPSANLTRALDDLQRELQELRDLVVRQQQRIAQLERLLIEAAK